MNIKPLIERLSQLTGKKVILQELAIEGTIMTVLKNWEEFRNEVNDWHQPDKYKNPFHMWKELNAEVTKEWQSKHKYPKHVAICVEKQWHADAGDALFELISTDDRITYQYTGVIK